MQVYDSNLIIKPKKIKKLVLECISVMQSHLISNGLQFSIIA